MATKSSATRMNIFYTDGIVSSNEATIKSIWHESIGRTSSLTTESVISKGSYRMRAYLLSNRFSCTFYSVSRVVVLTTKTKLAGHFERFTVRTDVCNLMSHSTFTVNGISSRAL